MDGTKHLGLNEKAPRTTMSPDGFIGHATVSYEISRKVAKRVMRLFLEAPHVYEKWIANATTHEWPAEAECLSDVPAYHGKVTLRLHDVLADGPYYCEVGSHTLVNGFTRALNGEYRGSALDLLDGEGDADDANHIIQLGIFEEVPY